MNHDGQRMLVAKGGRGGRGNEYFKTSRMNAPVFAERGEPGAERWLNVELKLIADVVSFLNCCTIQSISPIY